MERPISKIAEVYRHFKGNYYWIWDIFGNEIEEKNLLQ